MQDVVPYSRFSKLTHEFLVTREMMTSCCCLLFCGFYQKSESAIDWTGCRNFVQQAFAYLNGIGEHEASERLRQPVLDNAMNNLTRLRKRVLRSMHDAMSNDPAWVAEHDRRLAQYSHRLLRAAALLTPAEGDLWHLLLSRSAPEK
ncbi:hypothetical protein ACFY3M_47685 [Streptomyces mirabilis]|uniref:hypothetical protein n=1 Tax=Streptomyces mirabilis TaxID=68239 RepID=UPI0036A04905